MTLGNIFNLLILKFFIFEMEIIAVPTSVLLWELNELMPLKCLLTTNNEQSEKEIKKVIP